MSNQPTITLYHVQEDSDLKKHKAIAQGNSITLRTINISEEPLTPRQLFQIAEQFEGGLEGLINKESEQYKEELKDHDYSDKELLNVLVKKPQMLKLPIVEYGNKAHLCEKARDILKYSSATPKINAYSHDENVTHSK
jgi:arsenate reductase-like glutaredoxin family protein